MYLFIKNKPCYKISDDPETQKEYDAKSNNFFITTQLNKLEHVEGEADMIFESFDESEVIVFKIASLNFKHVLARGSICND